MSARLVLFDVDGTLLLSSGAGRRAMASAGEAVLGRPCALDAVEVAGRLDPLIARDALAASGAEAPDELLPRFRRAYARALAAAFEAGVRAWSLPGVEALLDRLAAEPGVTIGLLTGNWEETGRLKLRAAGLDAARFPVAAWGSDAGARRDLLAVARRRHAEHTGRDVAPAEVVVVGDTPHDVDVARHGGARALAVATGPDHDRAALARCEPDLLVDDLEDTETVLAFLRASS